jgi:hypothetical protein
MEKQEAHMVKKIYQFIELLSKGAFFLILTPQVLNPIDHGNRRIFIDTKYNLPPKGLWGLGPWVQRLT